MDKIDTYFNSFDAANTEFFKGANFVAKSAAANMKGQCFQETNPKCS